MSVPRTRLTFLLTSSCFMATIIVFISILVPDYSQRPLLCESVLSIIFQICQSNMNESKNNTQY